MLAEELHRFRDGHVQHVVDVLPIVVHVEDILLETVSMTGFALQHEIGHELHLYGDDASALALLTAPTVGIEREVLRREAQLLRQRLCCVEVAYGVVGFHVGSGIRACRLADGILVHKLNMLYGIDVAAEAEVFAWCVADLSEMSLQGRVEDTLDET